MRAQLEEEAIAQLLCISGQDFPRSATKRRVRTMRTNMTTLTGPWGFQLWLRASVVLQGARSPRQGHVIIGKYAHRSTDF